MRIASLLSNCLSVAVMTTAASITGVAAETISDNRGTPQIAQDTSTEPLLLDVTGRLEPGDEQLDDDSFVDVYSFSGQAGQTVTILLSSTTFDPYLLLEDSQGNLLAENNDIGYGNNNAALIITLPTDSTYRILVNSYVSEEQGAYWLQAAPTDLAQTNPLLSLEETQRLTAEQAFQQGSQHYDRAEFRDAITAFDTTLALYQRLGDQVGEVWAYANLGNVHYRLGQYDQALAYFQKALALSQEIGYIAGEGGAYVNLGLAYLRLGQYDQSLAFNQKALAIYQESSDRAGEGLAYTNLGLVYFSLGQYDQALAHFEQRLEIAQELEDRPGEGLTYSNLGIVYSVLGQYDQALVYFQQDLEITQEFGDRSGEVLTYGNLGLVYDGLGQYDQALAYSQQALMIAQEIGDKAGESWIYGNLGLAYNSLGQYERALENLQRAVMIAQEIGDRPGEGTNYSNLGIVHNSLEQYEQATQVLRRAIGIYESLRPEELGDINLLALLDTQLNAYGYLQNVLVLQERLRTALEIADRSRAQALKLQLLQTLPEEQAAPWTDHLSIEAIQQIATDQDATLVSYTVLWNGKVLIWVIQPDRQIHQASSDLTALPEDVDDVLNRYATFDAARSPNRPETPLQELVRGTQAERMEGAEATDEEDLGLEELYQVLIAPIADLLPENETDSVIFIPHRELFQVPFATLQNPETSEYLIENHTISIAPSILSGTYPRTSGSTQWQ